MMAFDEAARLVRLQERLRNATYHEMRKDGGHKSSEGAVSLVFHLPPVVGDSADPYWTVEAYSYLLCPDGRSGMWTGRSAAEAIAKAEDAIKLWCMPAEMEQFGALMGIEPDADEDQFGGPA